MSVFITAEEFDTSMKKLGVDEVCPKIAVAVSGGGDSLALALLAEDWVKARGGTVLALTVDHGLREGSADEADKVGRLLRAFGIRHDILVWRGSKPATHIQEEARNARYALLLETCRERGFPVLAVAHNLEDQIETFWMRLAHGSGLDGLAAMASSREVDGVTIIRPVLSFSREQLRATCVQRKIEWMEDPSNKNEKYLRVKLRQFEELLAGEGMTPARLSQTLQKLEDARAALQSVAAEAATSCVQLHPEGYVTLVLTVWKNFPRELQRRILAQAISMVAVQDYPTGFDGVEHLRQDLLGADFAGRTLGGCEIFPARDGVALILREAAAAEGRVKVMEGMVWDRRFAVSGIQSDTLEIGILGDAGISELKKHTDGGGAVLKRLESLPFKVRRGLPALWREGNLVAVPVVGYYSQGCPDHAQTDIMTVMPPEKTK